MKNEQTEEAKANAMKTTAISITRTKDDDGRTCYEWGFEMNGEHLGGYCRTVADARNDAETMRAKLKANK